MLDMRLPLKPSTDDGVVAGSGNFLADRGYADPEETRIKYLMCNQIAVIADDRNWSHVKVAEVTGLPQSEVSRIVNGNVSDVSVWVLMRALNSLGQNILIEFSSASADVGQVFTSFIETETDCGYCVDDLT
jgi:predicted XRE-type DNA-binding protein